MKVDVIIPVYKPDETFFQLIESLEKQTIPVNDIIIMNTEEKYFERLTYERSDLDKYQNIHVFHLSKREFDHGFTRHMGVLKSRGDIFVMMTQDAIPSDNQLIEKLVKVFENENIVSAYARQLPKEDCGIIERYQREFNYPSESCVKSKKDLDVLGIKTYFCSNVCCAYRRSTYDKLGGFIHKTIFNEDMIFASKVIEEGYEIAYVADATVYHSHNYTCGQQFHRNFDLGVSQAEHPEIFEAVPSEGEGIKSVKATMKYLCNQKKKRLIPKLILHSGYKYLGYRFGKGYEKLPRKWVIAFSMNKEYWK